MTKKGLDEDRLKFFKGMGGVEASESDKSESDKTESENDESIISESDKSGSRISDSDKTELGEIKSDIPEAVKPESDETESGLSESDIRRPINKRKKQISKISLPKSRAPSNMPKIRARKVDDSVLNQAMLAASKSPKVSIYSPFIAAVMKCNELTTIGYKPSADSRELLEKALEQFYPDVCEKVRKYMENK